MKRLLVFLLLAFGGGLVRAEETVKLVEVRKIWDQAPHNAFTDLVRFQDRWFCVFREGKGHVSPNGALRVITSADGEKWESAALITSPTSDLRDAKITTTPDGQLMLSGAEALHDKAKKTHQSLAWFSNDGRAWSDKHDIGDPDFWLWRVTWHKGKAYGIGYGCGNDQSIRLYSSSEGKKFDTLVERLFDVGYPTETSLVFDGDTCYCLLRRDGKPNSGLLGISQPPYANWEWKDLGRQIGGPHMIRLPDGRFIAAVRLYDGNERTALAWIDPHAGKLTEFLQLPSGGDTSYAGLVWHDGLLWVSYYSSHEAKTSIYLAKVRVTADPERKAIHSELQQLQNRLVALRNDPSVKPDHWADAQIFVKGVVWALDFEPTLDAQNRELVRNALRRARERMDALAAGRQPWSAKHGRSIRGFISAVDGSTQPYGLVIPASYDPAKPIRLDVVLHGSRRATGIGDLMFIHDYDRGDNLGDEGGGSQPAPHVNYIEVHPMGRLGENAYRFEGETDVYEAIEAVCHNYPIDRRRIVLRGSSLGGVGTWQLGLKRPDRFVALGPTAGPVDTIEFAGSPWPHFVRLEPLIPWQKTMLHLVDAIDYAANAGMVPVVAAMGDKDPYFPSHLLMQKAFEKERIPFVGLIDHGAGHSVTPKVSQEQLRLLGEHAAEGLDPSPKHIRFVTWTLKFSRCHWIEILGLEAHYQRAEMDARMADDGSIIVAEPKNITRFAIGPPASLAPRATVTVGGRTIAVPQQKTDAPRTIVIERRDGMWQCQGNLNEVTLAGKRPGVQGPIDDAFATPFLCVRGTGHAWNPAVGAWAEASLKRFAHEWRRHYRGDLPVKDDTAVTQDDLRRCNLILFGDPGSNRWISDIVPKLPLHWTRRQIQLGSERYSAADHALQLIFPNPLLGAQGHYVVFNSGHTYHDGELRFSYMVFPRLGDWAVTKVGQNPASAPVPTVAETVLQSGFFDEGWAIR